MEKNVAMLQNVTIPVEKKINNHSGAFRLFFREQFVRVGRKRDHD